MPWWQWTIEIAVSLVLVVVAVFLLLLAFLWIDWLTTKRESTTTFSLFPQVPEKPAGAPRRLLVYFPDALADGTTSIQPIMETLRQQGDLLTVSYGTQHFNAQRIQQDVIVHLNAMRGYDEFAFVGSSLGGLMALDVHEYIRQNADDIHETPTIYLIDSPSPGVDDLFIPRALGWLLRIVRFGVVANMLAAPIMRRNIIVPRDENIELQVNRTLVKKHAYEAQLPFTLSALRDQVTYIIGHKPLKAAQFAGLESMVYFHCHRNNETVRQPQAMLSWFIATARLKNIEVMVDSPHCDFEARPLTWNRAMTEGFERSLQRSS